MDVNPARGAAGRSSAPFDTTIWPMVFSAAQSGSPEAREALAELCRIYWQPVYAFIRRQGYTCHDAQDLAQEFFVHVIEKRTVGRAERARGRFRSFLLGALTRFLADETARRRAQKRGAGASFVFLDADDAESRLPPELAHDGSTPEKLADAPRARALLRGALAQVEQDFALVGKADTFGLVQGFLPGAAEPAESYRAVAVRLGISEPALKSLIHRLRLRYRALLRRLVAGGGAAATPQDVDEEIRHLCAAAALERETDGGRAL